MSTREVAIHQASVKLAKQLKYAAAKPANAAASITHHNASTKEPLIAPAMVCTRLGAGQLSRNGRPA